MIEHLRLSRSEVRSLIGVPKYNDEKLREVLEVGSGFTSFFDSRIEFDKAELENRGTEFDMNEDVIHGIHFHGGVDGQKLISWGVEDSKIDKNDLTKVYEVEAVLLNHEVVKCVLNSDPLGRRPYLHASYQKTPGSVWGRSIPTLMRDVQRMCNACARALADNMGLSSGPQVEIYVDRLADSGPIEEMEPRKIWQLKSDPTGAGGRAIQFTDVPSNAQELLLVYQDFEMKADDITGIPRYAYGNEKTAGAATTAKGLAMLLESASKGIKDAIRNIDLGVIIPRIEMQFYYTMVTRKDLKYTGDIDIVTYGSEAIILKAAREAKRAEFIQITSNPIDQKIMGWAGRGDILREMSEDLGFPHNLIPSRLELKKLEIEEKAMEKKRLEIEAQKQSVGLQAVQAQSASNEKIAGQRTAVEMKKLEQNQMEASARSQLKLIELKAAKENALGKIGADLQKTKLKEDAQDRRTNKNLAVDILQTNNMRRQNVERGYR